MRGGLRWRGRRRRRRWGGGPAPCSLFTVGIWGGPHPEADCPPPAGGGGGGGDGTAANNGPTISAAPPQPWYENPCVTGALGKGALSAGIDAIGLIPEAGGIARIIGHGAGYRGIVADQLGANFIKAIGGSASTVQGGLGLFDTTPTGLLSTGLTIAGFIPGAGQVASVGSLIVDIYKTAKAIGQCP